MTLDCYSACSVYLTLVRMDQKDLSDLKITLRPNFKQIHLMSSLIPET